MSFLWHSGSQSTRKSGSIHEARKLKREFLIAIRTISLRVSMRNLAKYRGYKTSKHKGVLNDEHSGRFFFALCLSLSYSEAVEFIARRFLLLAPRRDKYRQIELLQTARQTPPR